MRFHNNEVTLTTMANVSPQKHSSNLKNGTSGGANSCKSLKEDSGAQEIGTISQRLGDDLVPLAMTVTDSVSEDNIIEDDDGPAEEDERKGERKLK